MIQTHWPDAWKWNCEALQDGEVRSFGEHVRWQSADRFTDVLEMTHKLGLDQFVFLKSLPASESVPFDVADGFKNVLEPFAGISHSATASCSTRPLMRGFRLRSVATSTSGPSRSWSTIKSPPMRRQGKSKKVKGQFPGDRADP